MKMAIKAAYLIVLFFLFSCSKSTLTEVSRISNEAASLDAVSVIKNTDATVAMPTEIHIVLKGQPLNETPVFRADNVEGLSLVWESELKLVIHADKARVFLHLPTITINSLDKKSMTIIVQLEIKYLS